MLERLSRSGILKDFVLYTGRSRQEQRRIISKAKTQLIQQLYIMPDVADSYLSIIASVFEWDIGVSTPKSRQTYGKKALYVAVIAVIVCIVPLSRRQDDRACPKGKTIKYNQRRDC